MHSCGMQAAWSTSLRQKVADVRGKHAHHTWRRVGAQVALPEGTAQLLDAAAQGCKGGRAGQQGCRAHGGHAAQQTSQQTQKACWLCRALQRPAQAKMLHCMEFASADCFAQLRASGQATSADGRRRAGLGLCWPLCLVQCPAISPTRRPAGHAPTQCRAAHLPP